MNPPHIFKQGDACTLVDMKGRRKSATVILASTNGVSIAVQFEGLFSPQGGIGGFLGMMPLMWTGERFESFDVTGEAEAVGTVIVEPLPG